jgi:hypothetical protein
VCSIAASGERELAKILFGDEALLNHLKRFGYDIRKVGHVKVREVGAEHRPQPKAHPRIEGS